MKRLCSVSCNLLLFGFVLFACSSSDDPKEIEKPEEPVIETPDPEPETPVFEMSPEAVKLLEYIKEIAGKQMLTGVMANVNWNLNEATWVYKHVGKWPAINGFDYLHFIYSQKDGWIDYENTTVVEQWWNDGGIVSAMWHWNVLANDGVNYTCTPGAQNDKTHTNFDIRKIEDEHSAEYKQMVKDIDQIAGYLTLLRDKNIPVLWRPLHEAAGNYYFFEEWGGTAWFWWGYHGAEPFKKLWRLMHDRFTKIHGLNNLIWVWTYEPKGYDDWYPGDDYVDITGSDLYNVKSSADMADRFQVMREHFGRYPVTLSECGSVAKISEQWNAGARWAYFMTWYDYNRTKDMTSPDFNQTTHEHADIEWWRDVFNCPFTLSRDRLPNLK